MSILKENVTAAATNQKLAGGELDRLADYDRATRSAYCAGCAHICESQLTQDVPVCKIMRYMMYAHGYGDPARARRKFRRIPSDVRQSLATLDYADAEAQCPRNMPIGHLMRAAVKELG